MCSSQLVVASIRPSVCVSLRQEAANTNTTVGGILLQYYRRKLGSVCIPRIIYTPRLSHYKQQHLISGYFTCFYTDYYCKGMLIHNMENGLPILILSALLAFVQSTAQKDNVYVQDVHCDRIRNITNLSAVISSHRAVTTSPYHLSKDCTIVISAPRGQQINLRFEFFDLQPSFDVESKECKPRIGDKLMIYEYADTTKAPSLKPDKTYCGGSGKFPPDYQSSSNVLGVRFLSDDIPSEKDYGFRFTYTTFKSEESNDCFMCSDGTMCINSSVVCDDIINCNDDSDESFELCSAEKSNIIQEWIDWLGMEVVIIIAAALGLVIIVMLITCFVCCCGCCSRKEKREPKPYRVPPTPRPTSFPSQSNFSSYSSASNGTANGRSYFQPPHMYPPIQNGGYSVVYNHDNGKVDFPQKL